MSEGRVSFEDLCSVLAGCLRLRGFGGERAARCAYLFAENSLVGVASHGLDRFPRFVEWIDRGWVDPEGRPQRVETFGSLERWDGHSGPGPLNAEACMERAVVLARRTGAGVVALRNTNHWMRAGTYAWQAAGAGLVGVCFTNTEPNLPPWGSATPKLGNNPLAIAIPRSNGRHLLYDGAMSQFSYGALEAAARRGETLPVPGGFDVAGEMTDDPGKILASKRALPIGYWKGAGLSLMIDLVATVLAAGRSTYDLGRLEGEYGVSQVFMAFAPGGLDGPVLLAVERTLADLHSARADDGSPVRHPGERLHAIRAENLRDGVPVDEAIWREVLDLSGRTPA